MTRCSLLHVHKCIERTDVRSLRAKKKMSVKHKRGGNTRGIHVRK